MVIDGPHLPTLGRFGGRGDTLGSVLPVDAQGLFSLPERMN